MAVITRQLRIGIAAAVFCFGVFVAGCSSSPSDEQKRQLDDLRAEVSSLESQVSAKEKEKSDLEKQVAEKNGRIQQCKADQVAVKSVTK